jgi:hypothetical protein
MTRNRWNIILQRNVNVTYSGYLFDLERTMKLNACLHASYIKGVERLMYSVMLSFFYFQAVL